MPILKPAAERVAVTILSNTYEIKRIAEIVSAAVRLRSDEEVEDLCKRILAARKIKKHLCKNPERKRKPRTGPAYPMPEERIEGIA